MIGCSDEEDTVYEKKPTDEKTDSIPPGEDFKMEFEKGYVAKIDVRTKRVVGACEVGWEPEAIQLYDGKLYVANSGGYEQSEDTHEFETTLSVIDTATMKLIKTINTGYKNLYGDMALAGKYLCISSCGDYYEVAPHTIIMNCETEEMHVLDFPSNNSVSDGKSFYTIGSSFSYILGTNAFHAHTINPVTMEVTDEVFSPSITQKLESLEAPYELYLSPYTHNVYFTDAKTYASAGRLYGYTFSGEKLFEPQKTYINPAHILALKGEVENLILCNEGNWQSDNGQLSYYDANAKAITNGWFRQVNNSKLGDTPNDIVQVNDTLIAVSVNWSNIIQYIRPDGTACGATENVPNNRRLCSDGRYLYVTSYAHFVGKR